VSLLLMNERSGKRMDEDTWVSLDFAASRNWRLFDSSCRKAALPGPLLSVLVLVFGLQLPDFSLWLPSFVFFFSGILVLHYLQDFFELLVGSLNSRGRQR